MRGVEMMFVGHLAADVQKKESNGRAFLSFCVAVKDIVRNAQGSYTEQTTWVNCTWNYDGGNLLPYLVKGAQVLIRGKAKTHVYTDKTGASVASLDCSVLDFNFLGSPRNQQQQAQAPQAPQTQIPPAMQEKIDMVQKTLMPNDDLPF